MECNLVGTLTILKTMGIVPNFSALAREYKKERHTIKKMYAEPKEAKEKVKKPSQFDPYRDLIKELLSNSAVTIKAAFWFLKNESKMPGTYNGFKSFIRINNLRNEVLRSTPHPLYETDPGDMIQNDWVEDIKLSTVEGEIINFNLYSATLGYSRYHYFEYTDFKTETDYKRCTIHLLQAIGGLPKRILTDNMSAIVNVNGRTKKKHPSIIQFEKDIGVPIELCKVRSPETKGKDESSNRFVKWLYAYDGKIKNKEHLLQIIKIFNLDINKQVNTRTNMPPILLFQKEKEYLRPLPNNIMLLNYEDEVYNCKVPSTFVVNYKGAKYSVPPYLINKTISIKERGETIYIYYKNDLVAEHKKAKPKSINYDKNHYKLGLIGKFKDDSNIEETTNKNLAKFKDFGDET